MTYTGHETRSGDIIVTESSSCDPATFFTTYICTRRPVVLTGLYSDLHDIKKLVGIADSARLFDTYELAGQADFTHLRRNGSTSTVQIEPFNETIGTFGTAAKRTTTPFQNFLDLLGHDAEQGRWYLTTQYDETEHDQDEGSEGIDGTPQLDPICPAPTDKFVLDFPLRPSLMGGLVLQQCNLWIGNSNDGSSSGLHHDFHDNLYLLLRGRKRFVLYPPNAHPHLHLRGHVKKCWPNGLLVYGDEEHDDEGEDGSPVLRPDGLDPLDAARWRVVHLQQAVANLAASHLSSDVGTEKEKKKRAKAQKDLEKRLQMAKKEVAALLPHDDLDDDDEEENSEEDEEGLDKLNGDEPDSDSDWDVNSVEDGDALLAQLDDLDDSAPVTDSTAPPKSEPPSFSRISPRSLHAYLGLDSSPNQAPAKPKKKSKKSKTTELVPAPGCPAPLIVHLEPGQMLYLPAGWFHEVTSYSSSTEDGGHEAHIAFNYWFHPPDGDTFEKPYSDHEVWSATSKEVDTQFAALREKAVKAQAKVVEVTDKGVKQAKEGSPNALVSMSTNRPSKRTRQDQDEKSHGPGGVKREKRAKSERKTRPSAAIRARRKARNLVRKGRVVEL